MWAMGIEPKTPGEEGTEPSLQHAVFHFKVFILKWHKWEYAHLNVTHLKPQMKLLTRTSAGKATTGEIGWSMPMRKRRH